MAKRQTRESLEFSNSILAKQQTLYVHALQDALSGQWQAVEYASDGNDRIVFRLSRAAAPHGGILTWEYHLGANEYPSIIVWYLDEVDVHAIPQFGWGAFDRIKVAAYKIQTLLMVSTG